jgi:hypothetical protein
MEENGQAGAQRRGLAGAQLLIIVCCKCRSFREKMRLGNRCRPFQAASCAAFSPRKNLLLRGKCCVG